MTTHYEVLGVAENASPEQIKKGYRSQSSKFHPDKNSGRTEWANGWMQRINEAYKILSNPTSRARYDAELRAERSQRGQDDAQKQAQARAEADYKRWHQQESANREAAAKEAAKAAEQARRQSRTDKVAMVFWCLVILLVLGHNISYKILGIGKPETKPKTQVSTPVEDNQTPQVTPTVIEIQPSKTEFSETPIAYGVFTVRSSLGGGGIYKGKEQLLETDLISAAYQDPAFPDLVVFQHACSGTACPTEYVLANIRTGELFDSPVYGDSAQIRIRYKGQPRQELEISGVVGTDQLGDSIIAGFIYHPTIGWVHSYADERWVQFLKDKKYPFDFFDDNTLRKPLLKKLDTYTDKTLFKVLRQSISVSSHVRLIRGQYALLEGCMAHNCGWSWGVGVVDITNHQFHFILFDDGVFRHELHSHPAVTESQAQDLEEVFRKSYLLRDYQVKVDNKTFPDHVIFRISERGKK